MFGKKKARQPTINTLVGAQTRVHGDVEFTGGFLVDGYVKGNVQASGDEHATLSISERGCVEGSVVVPHVMLNGTVKGDVKATQKVELGPKARVIGNVQYKLIEMAIGAEVNGKLIHESEGSRTPKVARSADSPAQSTGADGEPQAAPVGAMHAANAAGD
jgi:cytoskeletal protein CcmA (bactofilin family)